MITKILKHLQDNPGRAFSPRELVEALKIKPSRKREVKNLLKDLAREGKLITYHKKFQLAESVPQMKGLLRLHRKGFGFVISETPGETDVFVPARWMNHALPDDEVMVEYQTRSDGRREGRVVDVLRRGREQWTGRLEKWGKQYVVVNDDYKSLDLHIVIPSKKIKKAKLGDMVSVKITDFPTYKDQGYQGEIVAVLGDPNDESTVLNTVLARYGLEADFPAAVMAQAKKLSGKISPAEKKKRVDLTDKAFLTIDGITARDFDDAVYVEKQGQSYHLYVAIADVAHYVKPKSSIDDEAKSRSTSVYFPDFCLPMLPEKLSNNLCSLKGGELRPVLCCEMKMSVAGGIQEAWVYEALIKSQHRGIYEEIQDYFDGIKPKVEFSPELKLSLKLMKTLAERMLNQRKKRGAIDFDLPEAKIIYDGKGKIQAIVKSTRFFSHQLIEEFMIAANQAVASFCQSRGVPILFRVHDKPDPVKLLEFKNLVENFGFSFPAKKSQDAKVLAQFVEKIQDHPLSMLLNQVLLRSMQQAIYDRENRGHYGLNLINYGHFTSPIRRYPDLILHRQLKAIIARMSNKKIHWQNKDAAQPKFFAQMLKKKSVSNPIYKEEEVVSFGPWCSKKEREAMDAERDMVAYKRSQFMQDHLGESFYGTIKNVTKRGMWVELEPHFVEGFLSVAELKDDYYWFDAQKVRLIGRRRKKKYSVGDKLKVVIAEVDEENRQILLATEI